MNMKKIPIYLLALVLITAASASWGFVSGDDALLRKGKELMRDGKFQRAERVFSEAIAQNPSDPRGYAGRGAAYMGMGETDRAIGEFTRAIELDPQFDRAYEGRGEAALKQNRYKDAYMDFARALKLNPSNDHARKMMEEAARLNEEKFGHRLSFDESWQPGTPPAGHEYDKRPMRDKKPPRQDERQDERVRGGERPEDRRMGQDEQRPVAPQSMGTITIVETGASAADARFAEGNTHLKYNQLDQAIAEYERAISIDPRHTRAYLNMGIAYARKGDYGKAANAYTKALNIDPNYDKAYFNRGVAHEKLGSADKAIADYQKAIEVNPSFDSPRRNLTRLAGSGAATAASAAKPAAAKPASSDLLTGIPKASEPNPDAIAVIIGNRTYRKAKSVEFAHNDADAMKAYLITTLGYKEGNVFIVKDASLADMTLYFGNQQSHKGKLFNAVKEGKSDVFVYYSGHGAPGLKDHKGYFVPVEADPQYIELGGYPSDVFYANLAKTPARSMTVVLDACFSGASLFENISPMVVEVKQPEAAFSNGIVMSSSGASQPSSWYNEMKHGMFTYFFLRGIKDGNADSDGDGALTFEELHGYVSDKTEGVPYYARRLHGVEQDPVMQGQYRGKVVVRY